MKKFYTKLIAVLIIISLLGTVIAGCGSKTQSEARKKVLKVSMGLGEAEWKVMKKIFSHHLSKSMV
jgi:carbohydrate ABC transporter substrate-binding protein, CUT1 family (TC 3.A.1.1.-)